ncbi:hypothetical protein GCM10025794_31470 [Massilia kyonggiensis]
MELLRAGHPSLMSEMVYVWAPQTSTHPSSLVTAASLLMVGPE